MQDVTLIKTKAELRRLTYWDIRERELTKEEITHLLVLCDALWLHSGNPKDPHVELNSGRYSNGFVDVLRALRYTRLCELLAHQMVRQIEKKLREFERDIVVEWVVGSDHAGAAFSHSVATWMGAQHDFTEKGFVGEQDWRRFVIKPDEVILQVEELMTTARTLLVVREGIRIGNPHTVTFAPLVAVLVHRSHVYEIDETPVVYLVHYDIAVWDPENCPLCAEGSERLRPKQQWLKLTGKE